LIASKTLCMVAETESAEMMDRAPARAIRCPQN
jgi:hypothetical protein